MNTITEPVNGKFADVTDDILKTIHSDELDERDSTDNEDNC